MSNEDNADTRYVAMAVSGIVPARPAGNYCEVLQWEGLLFVSGHGPVDGDTVGLVGSELTLAEGYACARSAALNCLTSIRDRVGSLDRVDRLLSLTVYVRALPDFERHPEVADGASDLFAEVFGAERGRATRAAVGVASLPFALPVELKLVAAMRK